MSASAIITIITAITINITFAIIPTLTINITITVNITVITILTVLTRASTRRSTAKPRLLAELQPQTIATSFGRWQEEMSALGVALNHLPLWVIWDYIGLYKDYIGIMEKVETTIVYWGYIGIMEKENVKYYRA